MNLLNAWCPVKCFIVTEKVSYSYYKVVSANWYVCVL